MNGDNQAGLVELRNRYMQELIAAQEEGRTLPPFGQWISEQKNQAKLASLAAPEYGNVR